MPRLCPLATISHSTSKMKLDLYQIDAFTDKIFGGNPACVVPVNSGHVDPPFRDVDPPAQQALIVRAK